MEQHTRTPWEVEDRTNIVASDRLIANTGGYSCNFQLTRLENEANAEHIIKCVNSHDKLVEALKNTTESTLKWIKVLSKQGGFLLSAVVLASLKQAQEVLAEAEKGGH